MCIFEECGAFKSLCFAPFLKLQGSWLKKLHTHIHHHAPCPLPLTITDLDILFTFGWTIFIPTLFYTPPHNSSRVLWFHVGRPWVGPSVCPSIRFSFPDDNLSKHQWIFTKHGMCFDIVEILFGIADGQISSIFDSYLPKTRPCFRFRTITWVNNKGFSPNSLYALTLRRFGLGLLMSKFRQIFTELSARNMPIFSFPDDNE